MLRAFALWLAAERQQTESTIVLRVGYARHFVDALTKRGALYSATAFQSLSIDDIEAFFVRHGRRHGLAWRRSMGASLRLLLAFAASRGWTSATLASAVPGVRTYRLSKVPRGLSEAEVGTLLREHGEASARDRAVLLILVTYGVRRAQISALRLSDIEWSRRMISFSAHKGGKPVDHELTAAVAQAIAQYLRDERPPSSSLHVFLRSRRPYLPLAPMAITELIAQLMRRAGLPPRRPHALRHAFATRLLRHGYSLKVIADLLGHRSLSSVGVYAKVDFARLAQVASEWPEVQS
jgi:integrase/recombinase XerD